MNNLVCKSCGTVNEQGSKFCATCGKPLFAAADRMVQNAGLNQLPNYEHNQKKAVYGNEGYSVSPVTYTQTKPRRARYIFETVLLIFSLICFVCSLAFFIHSNSDSTASADMVEIPPLTAEMAEEIINASTDFPYYYFQERDMLNMDDYIIHPLSVGTEYEVRCYSVDGIESLDDYYSYFERYATRDIIEEHLSNDAYYQLSGSKVYFSPNEWMGRDPVIAENLVIEKTDDETCLIVNYYSTRYTIRYIDGLFKVTSVSY